MIKGGVASMQNKSKNWADIQFIISSISVALTLGLWGVFASNQKTGASVTGEVVVPTQQPDPVVAPQPQLLPGQKLLLGGTAPQPPQQIVVTNGGGGGGGKKGGGAASTHSSRP